VPIKIQTGKVTEALQRAFGFKGKYTPMLDEIVVPVYQVSDPVPAASQKLCVGTIKVDVFPAGTESAGVQFSNPKNSGVLASVTAVTLAVTKGVGPGTVLLYDVRFDTTGAEFAPGAFVTEQQGHFRDQRESQPGARSQRALCKLLGQGDNIINGFSDATTFTHVTIKSDETFAEMVSGLAAGARQNLMVLPPGKLFTIQAADVLSADGLPLLMNVVWLETPIGQQPAAGIPP